MLHIPLFKILGVSVSRTFTIEHNCIVIKNNEKGYFIFYSDI